MERRFLQLLRILYGSYAVFQSRSPYGRTCPCTPKVASFLEVAEYSKTCTIRKNKIEVFSKSTDLTLFMES